MRFQFKISLWFGIRFDSDDGKKFGKPLEEPLSYKLQDDERYQGEFLRFFYILVFTF